jgi:hypothetical protein
MAVISANERHLEANRRNIGGASSRPHSSRFPIDSIDPFGAGAASLQ